MSIRKYSKEENTKVLEWLDNYKYVPRSEFERLYKAMDRFVRWELINLASKYMYAEFDARGFLTVKGVEYWNNNKSYPYFEPLQACYIFTRYRKSPRLRKIIAKAFVDASDDFFNKLIKLLVNHKFADGIRDFPSMTYLYTGCLYFKDTILKEVKRAEEKAEKELIERLHKEQAFEQEHQEAFYRWKAYITRRCERDNEAYERKQKQKKGGK